MSNKKTTDADDAQIASDTDAPMDEPRVRVRVHPVKHKVRRNMTREKKKNLQKQNNENQNLAKKVRRNLEDKVERDVDAAGTAPGGTRQDQYKASNKATQEAANQVSRRKIKQIDVIVEDQRDGHQTTAIPQEGAPPNDEED